MYECVLNSCSVIYLNIIIQVEVNSDKIDSFRAENPKGWLAEEKIYLENLANDSMESNPAPPDL